MSDNGLFVVLVIIALFVAFAVLQYLESDQKGVCRWWQPHKWGTWGAPETWIVEWPYLGIKGTVQRQERTCLRCHKVSGRETT